MTAGGDKNPREELGQDVVAFDEDEVMPRPHVANGNHRGLAFLSTSRPASNSSKSRS